MISGARRAARWVIPAAGRWVTGGTRRFNSLRGGGARSWPSWLAITRAIAVINVVLLIPLVLRFQSWPATWLAMEALVLPLSFAVLPVARWAVWLARAAGAALVLVVLVGLANAATWLLLRRPLNLYLDWRLLRSGHHLLTSNLGDALALALEAGLVVLLGLVGWGISRLLAQCLGRVRWLRTRLAVGSMAAVATAAIASPSVLGYWPSSFAPSSELARGQVERWQASRREMNRFGEKLTQRDAQAVALTGLEQVDVVVAFIESYGRSVHSDPRYAERVAPGLAALAQAVADRDLAVVTGYLRSPVRGGQSWLAHASLLSGLWLDNQLRYDIMLRQQPPTLIDDFRRTGHRSIGVFPAITRAWPAGQRLGYDAVYSARNMGYRGPSLNWVTMPDQFSWSWLQRSVRAPSEEPVFAELALISSHAPWTPVLPVIDDWDRIDDGRVFERWSDRGPPPSELWRDTARVREYFGRAMNYALTVAAGYTRRHVDERTLLVLLGDHQPAPLITGDGVSLAVPVHVISADPELLAPFRQRGFEPGVRGKDGAIVGRLSDWRGWLIEAFGSSAAAN